ncbi:hypothetical protein [Paenibacillus campinasensis]|uniref:hypothetical protein n=1 Tax=Paenibacillus campinasensis TaxID=66347 RepID=UPI00117BEA34|nr:hypothetical protein [Paenibacillus campinasensis]
MELPKNIENWLKRNAPGYDVKPDTTHGYWIFIASKNGADKAQAYFERFHKHSVQKMEWRASWTWLAIHII